MGTLRAAPHLLGAHRQQALAGRDGDGCLPHPGVLNALLRLPADLRQRRHHPLCVVDVELLQADAGKVQLDLGDGGAAGAGAAVALHKGGVALQALWFLGGEVGAGCAGSCVEG